MLPHWKHLLQGSAIAELNPTKTFQREIHGQGHQNLRAWQQEQRKKNHPIEYRCISKDIYRQNCNGKSVTQRQHRCKQNAIDTELLKIVGKSTHIAARIQVEAYPHINLSSDKGNLQKGECNHNWIHRHDVCNAGNHSNKAGKDLVCNNQENEH